MVPALTSFDDTLTSSGPLGSFTWYSFNATIPLSTNGISFKVEIETNNGSTISDNGGNGFAIQNTVIFNPAFPCIFSSSAPSIATRNFTIAVIKGAAA